MKTYRVTLSNPYNRSLAHIPVLADSEAEASHKALQSCILKGATATFWRVIKVETA